MSVYFVAMAAGKDAKELQKENASNYSLLQY